jgi:hypothetical protein
MGQPDEIDRLLTTAAGKRKRLSARGPGDQVGFPHEITTGRRLSHELIVTSAVPAFG